MKHCYDMIHLWIKLFFLIFFQNHLGSASKFTVKVRQKCQSLWHWRLSIGYGNLIHGIWNIQGSNGVKKPQENTGYFQLNHVIIIGVCISLEFFQGSRMSTDRTNFTSLDKYRRLELIKVKFKLTVLVKRPNMDCPMEKMFVCQLF